MSRTEPNTVASWVHREGPRRGDNGGDPRHGALARGGGHGWIGEIRATGGGRQRLGLLMPSSIKDRDADKV